jgi:hypothetical protein
MKIDLSPEDIANFKTLLREYLGIVKRDDQISRLAKKLKRQIDKQEKKK